MQNRANHAPCLRKCCPLTGDASASKAAAALNAWLSRSPIFAAAARRLIAQHCAATVAAAPDGKSQEGPAEPVSTATVKQVQAATHNVLRVALRPLLAAQLAPVATAALAGAKPLVAGTVSRAVLALLTAPGLVIALPPELKRQLSGSSGLDRCCRSMDFLLSPAQPPTDTLSALSLSSGHKANAARVRAQLEFTSTDAASGMRNLAMLTLPESASTVRMFRRLAPACGRAACAST